MILNDILNVCILTEMMISGLIGMGAAGAPATGGVVRDSLSCSVLRRAAICQRDRWVGWPT